MKKKSFEVIVLMLCTVIVSFVITGPYFFTDTPFMLGWDYRVQYSITFEHVQDVIRTCLRLRTFPFYSWFDFLGSNFYCGKLFFSVNFYDWLFLFSNQSYDVIQMYLLFIKMAVSGFSFYCFSSYLNHKSTTKLIGSMCYAFSAFALDAVKDPFFLSFYTLVPFYFLLIESYFRKEKKSILYVFLVAFLLITNFYQFYSLSIITVIYFLYRYYILFGSFKGVVLSALKLIGYYLIGVLVSGVVTLPNFYHIISNSRLLSQSSQLYFEAVQPYFYLLVSLFFPTSTICNRALDFVSIFSYTTPNQTDLYVLLFSGMLIALMLPQALKKNKPLRIVYLIFLAIALIPFGNSMMHGFSEPSFRWLQFVVFFNISSVLDLLDHDYELDWSLFKKTVLIALSINVLSVPVLSWLTKTEFSMQEYTLFLGFSLFILVYYVLVTKKLWKLIAVTVVIEMAVVGYFSFYDNPYFKQYSYEWVEKATSVLGRRNQLMDHLNYMDSINGTEFFRVYVDRETIYWGYSPNLQLKYNIPGLISYNSMIDGYASELNKIIDCTDAFEWYLNIADPSMMTLTNVKYAIVTSEEAVPFKNFELAGEYYGLPLYQNLDYFSFGQSLNRIKTYDEVVTSADVLEYIICDEKDMNQIVSSLGNDADVIVSYAIRRQNGLSAFVESDQECFFISGVPFDQGWKVVINGEIVETYSVNGGMTGFALEQGGNEIEMYYLPEGIKIGACLTSIGLLMAIVLSVVLLKHEKKNG